MLKIRLLAIVLLLAGILVGYFIFSSEQSEQQEGTSFPFKFGLDLSGGTHLVYRADVSGVAPEEVRDAMSALRDVIERRINLFGVAEPNVQIERTAGIISDTQDERLIVELPGVTNIDQATAMIGQTPLLEFRLERPDGPEKENILNKLQTFKETLQQGEEISEADLPNVDELFTTTELTGRFLQKATLGFDQTTGAPRILLDFNKDGADLFAEITGENIGKILAIYLDGAPISQPVIQQEIRGGSAEITGVFTKEEAKQLVGRLNSGALPVPIELLSSQTIGSTLGQEAKTQGIKAGIVGLIAVAIFMLLWYRLPGLIAIIALGIYIALMLALFKIIPVTITAAGIAGFILSIGMAVDANVLIFERMKEELRTRSRSRAENNTDATQTSTDVRLAITEGFSRAWLAIRDSNISSIITAIILFWFGTSLIKGFALVFGIGVLISMITAISVTRTLLLAISSENTPQGITRFLFGAKS